MELSDKLHFGYITGKTSIKLIIFKLIFKFCT